MKASEILIKTKELINEPKKWTQHTAMRYDVNREVSYCLSGAISCATEDYNSSSTDVRDASIALGNAILESTKERYSSYVTWNDVTGRTHSEVMLVIDRAIEIAKCKEVKEEMESCQIQVTLP